MSGRPPTPSAIRSLQGNPGRRPLNSGEPSPTVVIKMPNAPRRLSARAARKWHEYGNELIHAGLLTMLGLPALERYCDAYEDLLEACEDLLEHGKYLYAPKGGGRYLNPSYNAKLAAENRMGSFETQFGMTPSAATRVRVFNPKQLDIFGDFLAGGMAPTDEGAVEVPYSQVRQLN